MDNQPPSLPSSPDTKPQPKQHLYYDVSHTGGIGASSKKRSAKMTRMAIAALASLLVLAGGAYVFGYYVPNRPANVYRSALNNTSAGYDQLVKYMTTTANKKSFNNVEAKGTFRFSGSGVSTDGAFEAHSDGKNTSFSGDVGLATSRIRLNGLAKDAANSDSPDLYLKISGIKGMETLYGVPGLDSLDSQWVAVDHTLFDTLAQQSGQLEGLDAKSGVSMPKQADITQAAQVIGAEADKYLFSTDDKTAVLHMDSFVGKETVDGKSTNHYKVTPSKDHLKAFATDLAKALDKSDLNKWAKDSYGSPLSKVLNVKAITRQADNVKRDTTFDVWVNAKTKLVHKIRFSDSRDSAHNYTEFGLNYGGGSEYPFFMRIVENSDGAASLGVFNLSLNTDTNAMNFAVNAKNTPSDATQKTVMAFDFTAKPSSGGVQATAPSDTISLSEALSRVGLGDYLDLLTQGGLNPELTGQTAQDDNFTISL